MARLLPRRGKSGRRLDYYGKHHASSSKMSAAWWQSHQRESASKTNFYIRQMLVNQKVPLRCTCIVQHCDQASNLSEVGFSFLCRDSAKFEQVQLCTRCSIGSCMVFLIEIGSSNR